MVVGGFIIGFISVCALLIAANLLVRRENRRRERSTNDWERHCTDADCGLVNILNNHERPYADWSQRNHG